MIVDDEMNETMRKRSLESSWLHNVIIVQSSRCLIVEIFIKRYALRPLVKESWIENNIRHEFNHFLFLQLRCNCGTAINFH